MSMTITEVCCTNLELSIGKEGRVWSATYKVEYTGTWSPLTVYAHEDVPSYGDALAEDMSSFCTSVKIRSVNPEARLGTVDATFTENQWVFTLGGPDKIRWSMSEESKEIFLTSDTTPKPIVNSAGFVYDALPTVGVASYTATITGLRDSYKLVPIRNYHIVNNGTIDLDGISIAEGQARIVGIEAEKKVVSGVEVIEHTWMLRFRESWDLKLADYGYRDKNGKRIVIDGEEVNTPWPLNGSGLPLAKGFDPVTGPKTNTHKITVPYDFSFFDWSF